MKNASLHTILIQTIFIASLLTSCGPAGYNDPFGDKFTAPGSSNPADKAGSDTTDGGTGSVDVGEDPIVEGTKPLPAPGSDGWDYYNKDGDPGWKNPGPDVETPIIPASNVANLLIAAPNGLNQPIAVGLPGTVEGIVSADIVAVLSHQLLKPPPVFVDQQVNLILRNPTPKWLQNIIPNAWASGYETPQDTICNDEKVTCCAINTDGSFTCPHRWGLAANEDKSLFIGLTNQAEVQYINAETKGSLPNLNLHVLNAAPQKVDRVAGELNLLSVKDGLSFGQRITKTNGRLRVMGSFEKDYRDETLPEFSSNISELRRDAAGRVLLRDSASGIRFKDDNAEETLTVDNAESYSRLIRMRDGKIAVGVRSTMESESVNNPARRLHEVIINDNIKTTDYDDWWDSSISNDPPIDVTAFDRITLADESRLAVVGYEATSGKINLAFSYRWKDPSAVNPDDLDAIITASEIIPVSGYKSIIEIAIIEANDGSALIAVNQGRFYLYQVQVEPKILDEKSDAIQITVSKPAQIPTGQQTLIRQGFEGGLDLVAYDSKAQKLSFYKALLDTVGIPYWSLIPQTVDLKGLADFSRLESTGWKLMSSDETSIFLTNDDGFVYSVPLEGVFNP